MMCEVSALPQDLDARPFEVRLDQLRTAWVDLAAQQPVLPFEHSHIQSQPVQRVGGLEAEQPATCHHGPTAVALLDVGTDLHRVARLPQRETARPVQPPDGGDGSARAHREDQPVEGEGFADAELHTPPTEIDPRGHGVEPRVDPVLVVPLLGQQVEALHRGAAVHQPGDAHSVVQRVGFTPDDVDLTVGVSAPDEVGGGDSGDAVAEHHHADDGAVVAGRFRAVAVTGFRSHRDSDRAALDPGAAGHPRGFAEAQPP